MTSLDDRLSELFHTAETPVDHVTGDRASVRARVRQRRVRQQAAVLAAAAMVVGLVGIVTLNLRGRDEGGRVDIGDEDGPTVTTSDAPSSTTATPSSTEAEAPPRPSVRDLDFGTLTYPAPCPTYDDRPVTLVDRAGENRISAGASVRAELGPVSYADADGDGDEEAIVVVRCSFVGANVDTGLLAAAYQASEEGQPALIGEPLTLAHIHEVSLDGVELTATMDVYAAGDAMCCPSSGAEQVWRFDGARFVLDSNRVIDPPGVPERKPPDSPTPAAGTCAEAPGDVVEVVIHADIPAPRCTQVTSDQRLRLRNETGQAITVSLADFEKTLENGESTVFDRAFAEYLEPGVHVVQTSAYAGGSGPEIWLTD